MTYLTLQQSEEMNVRPAIEHAIDHAIDISIATKLLVTRGNGHRQKNQCNECNQVHLVAVVDVCTSMYKCLYIDMRTDTSTHSIE